MPISSIPEIVEDLQKGRMIILVDDPDRENEGDLAMLADKITPEAVNFMAKEGRGLPGPRTWRGRGTSSPSEHERVVCSCVVARRRGSWTSRSWRAAPRSA